MESTAGTETTSTAMTTTTTPATDLAALPTKELEAIVTEGQQAFMRVGSALKVLQERKAYLDRGYATFGDYCRALWGFNRAHGYRLISAAETVSALMSPIGDTPAPLEREGKAKGEKA